MLFFYKVKLLHLNHCIQSYSLVCGCECITHKILHFAKHSTFALTQKNDSRVDLRQYKKKKSCIFGDMDCGFCIINDLLNFSELSPAMSALMQASTL